MAAAAPPPYRTLLLDMDGVLAEVSKSYRAAIIKTCHKYGATTVTDDSVTEMKRRGNANDDWQLSHRLIQEYYEKEKNEKTDITLAQVTETFEEYYQGHGDTPGLYTLETLIPTRETLLELKRRSHPGIGIVTGRPRSDCQKFLRDFDLEDLVSTTYCMEDGPSKPHKTAVETACKNLGIEPSKQVILVGDTPDDIRAALNAGCTGVGVTTPEAAAAQAALGKPHTEAILSQTMKEIGADVVLPPGFAELVDMFPPASS